ncbi:MAG: hypothetical protein HY329_00325 [Chloroflexi bacterium]|nr:hypothetical protein [Chloroflexota bacterium]
MPRPDELEELLGAGVGELLELLAQTRVTELDLQVGALRISVRRDRAAPSEHVEVDLPVPATPHVIAAPMVGFFHGRSLALGAEVGAGQVVGAVETLNVSYDVRTEHAGRVLDILVTEGQPVEFGQPLLVIGPDAQQPT